MRKLHLFVLVTFLTGCATAPGPEGQFPHVKEGAFTILLPPFINATDNEHAATALTQVTGSALLEKGVALVQTEEILSKTADDTAAKLEARNREIARENKATYLLVGTVHEYRYKSDLSANPAVGITLRLVKVEDGRTLWQGSSAKVGRFRASLTSTAQKAVRDLLSKVPLKVVL